MCVDVACMWCKVYYISVSAVLTDLLVGGLHGGNEACVEPSQSNDSNESNPSNDSLQNGAAQSRMATLHSVHQHKTNSDMYTHTHTTHAHTLIHTYTHTH